VTHREPEAAGLGQGDGLAKAAAGEAWPATRMASAAAISRPPLNLELMRERGGS